MDSPLAITLIQPDIYWEQIDANLASLEEKIWKIEGSTDLIILPELFSTGFTMNVSSLAEPMNGKTFRWLQQQASQKKAVITGSYIVKEKGHFYNRLIWMDPSGEFDYYDKRHLFRMAEENNFYTLGSKKIIKTIREWKILPLICYDLRFPVWSRYQSVTCEYDLLIYIANWPDQRIHVWNTLLKARAIENSSYVIGVNRVGVDGNNEKYTGQSVIINYKGDVLDDSKDDSSIHTFSLQKKDLIEFRNKFPVQLDADSFSISI